MALEGRLILAKHVYESSQDCRGAVDAIIIGLTEKVSNIAVVLGGLPGELINDSTDQHCFAFTGLALDPQEPATLSIPPSHKDIMFEHPAVRILKEAALLFFNSLFIKLGIRSLDIGTGDVDSRC
jgi:hypothetical protein